MPRFNFPNQNKVYIQNNRTNVFPLGNMWSTFNLDLQSNLGVLRISPRLRQVANSVNFANLGCPVTFNWFDGFIWSIAGTRIFFGGAEPDDTPWSEESASGVQTDYSSDESDAEVFNSTLATTTIDGLFTKVANGSGTGAWTQRDTLSSGAPHVMTYFKRFDRLYYSDLNNILRSVDTNWATADPGADYAIQLTVNDSETRLITCLDSNNQFIWIGTITRYDNQNRPGKVCVWDGISAQVTAEYDLNNAMGAMAIAVDPVYGNPFVMDTNGVLSEFNGSGFVEVARLPLPFYQLPYNPGDPDNERFIHPNGMYWTKNGTLRMLINNKANNGNIVENMPSGIWEWSRANGLVHIQSFSYNATASSTITDFGQNQVSRVGALASMNIPSTNAVDGTLMAGAIVFTDATTTISYIETDNSLDTIQKKGYFVTDWFESNDVANAWDDWFVSFRQFLASTDNMTFKYRLTEATPSYGNITWVNTTSFTVLNSAVDVSQYWTADTGGEVEILQGTGSGSCVHITNAVNNAGTWTVTIDEVVTGVTTGTAKARFQNWIKIFPQEDLSQVSAWNKWAIGSNTWPRIQIKGCFTFTGADEFYKAILTSNEDITPK